MLLNPNNFNRFLGKMGQSALWRPATACPCRNPHSGGADPACPACRGVGQVWCDPQCCTVALTGQKIQRAWAQFGMWEQGDLTVSLPSDSLAYGMGEFDRVTFTNSSEPFSIPLVRGREGPLMFQVVTVNRAVMRQVAAANTPLVAIAAPAVATDGSLTWPEGSPPIGTQYTLTGRKRPEYFCYGNFPQDRAHHHGLALPRVVVLRRFDLFGRHR